MICSSGHRQRHCEQKKDSSTCAAHQFASSGMTRAIDAHRSRDRAHNGVQAGTVRQAVAPQQGRVHTSISDFREGAGASGSASAPGDIRVWEETGCCTCSVHVKVWCGCNLARRCCCVQVSCFFQEIAEEISHSQRPLVDLGPGAAGGSLVPEDGQPQHRQEARLEHARQRPLQENKQSFQFNFPCARCASGAPPAGSLPCTCVPAAAAGDKERTSETRFDVVGLMVRKRRGAGRETG